MISLPNPNTQTQMTINRQQLIEDYAHTVVADMDLDTLIEFAFDTLVERLEQVSYNKLLEEVEQFYPELLES